jgi:phospholipid/cholesterol/gamma-HCH transport system ATP-binding protein
MIKVTDLEKGFGDTPVIKGISVTFDKGKTNLVIGKSGAGKSVFLKSLVGLFEIDNGEIYYDERKLSQLDDDKRKELRTDMGMVFQGNALFDSLTIEENVTFALGMFGKMTDEEKHDRANFCLNRVNLENVNNKFPAELSGGMQKRVAIARAISMNPKYLFLDEPNSGLDPTTAIVIDNLVKEITEEYNITTVINTHDMNSVMEIGDKIVYIMDGIKAWEGSSEELLDTNNKDIIDFVYSSELFRKIKNKL